MADPAEHKPPIDFFGIGASKSATTWWATCLAEHPKVCLAQPKEPHFFARRVGIFPEKPWPRYMNDWEWYASCYAHRVANQKCGEFSTHLLANGDDAPQRIKQYYPNAKFLAMLRDPCARLHSHYHFRRQFRPNKTVPPTFIEALSDDAFVGRSRYAEQLRKWFDMFPREQFMVRLDLDLKDDARALLDETWAFLGLPGFDAPSSHARVVPAAGVARGQRALVKMADRLRRAGLGRIVPNGALVAKILPKKRSAPPKITKDERAAALELLSDDIRDLEQLLGVQLGPWLA